MKSLRNLLLAPLALALAASVATPAFAGPAQNHIKSEQTKLTKLLKRPKTAARQKAVSGMLDKLIDFDKLLHDSLTDKYRQQATPEQLKEFRKLVKTLVRNNYKKNIEKSVKYKISYLGDATTPHGAVVHTSVQHKKKDGQLDTIAIDYRMHQKAGKWVIYDIVTENSSMVRNYRNQFNRVIRKKGWDTLLRKLRKKAAKK